MQSNRGNCELWFERVDPEARKPRKRAYDSANGAEPAPPAHLTVPNFLKVNILGVITTHVFPS
jgi:hypothetical protein